MLRALFKLQPANCLIFHNTHSMTQALHRRQRGLVAKEETLRHVHRLDSATKAAQTLEGTGRAAEAREIGVCEKGRAAAAPPYNCRNVCPRFFDVRLALLG